MGEAGGFLVIVVLCAEFSGSFCGLRCHLRWSKTSNKHIQDDCSGEFLWWWLLKICS
jgi:hypothetical protein